MLAKCTYFQDCLQFSVAKELERSRYGHSFYQFAEVDSGLRQARN